MKSARHHDSTLHGQCFRLPDRGNPHRRPTDCDRVVGEVGKVAQCFLLLLRQYCGGHGRPRSAQRLARYETVGQSGKDQESPHQAGIKARSKTYHFDKLGVTGGTFETVVISEPLVLTLMAEN